MERIAVFLILHQRLLRDTLATIIQDDVRLMLTGEYDSLEKALREIAVQRPRVLVLELLASPAETKDMFRVIRRHSVLTAAIILSAINSPAVARKIISHGASGFLTLNASREELIAAIMKVAAGKKFIGEATPAVLQPTIPVIPDTPAPVNKLTVRELQIIEFVRKGVSSKEIAVALKISTNTVEVHRHNMLKKFNVPNSAALINLLDKQGF